MNRLVWPSSARHSRSNSPVALSTLSEDAVTLAVQFATLADGTSYTAQTTLDAKAKNVRVVTQNSGHRPVQK